MGRDLLPLGVSHALDHEVPMDTPEDVQGLTLVPDARVVGSGTSISIRTMMLTRGNVWLGQ